MRMILFAWNNNAKKSEYKSFNGFVKHSAEEGSGFRAGRHLVMQAKQQVVGMVTWHKGLGGKARANPI